MRTGLSALYPLASRALAMLVLAPPCCSLLWGSCALPDVLLCDVGDAAALAPLRAALTIAVVMMSLLK